MTSGIYKICANHPEELVLYVGQSSNVEKRMERHLRDLRKGSHDNRLLQDWNNRFGGVRTGMVTECRLEELSECEKNHIEVLNPMFNIHGIGTTWRVFHWRHYWVRDEISWPRRHPENGGYPGWPEDDRLFHMYCCERIMKAGFNAANMVFAESLWVLMKVIHKYGY